GKCVAFRACLPAQLLERASVALGQTRSLCLCPALEFSRLADVKAVEEGTSIERDSGGHVSALAGLVEGRNVARDGLRVQPQRVDAENERRVELSPECIQQLLEAVPGIGRGALGPEAGK